MKIQELFLNVKKVLFLLFVVFCVSYLFVAVRQNFVGDDGFVLDYPEVEFKGDLSIDVNLALADVRDILDRYGVLLKPKTFSVNVDELREEFSQLSWVKNVSVVKEYPSKLLLVIEPKDIVAYMFSEGEYFPVDSDGKIIPAGVEYRSGLLITGEGANESLKDFLLVAKKYPRIWNKVVYLQYINNLRWNVFLYDVEDGILIKFAKDNLEDALEKINKFDIEQDLLKRNISEIDIRDINKILIKQRDL
ncbi:MAG: cell division protein FtsQ/DivIB [Alphaproteobacteria bacterium]